LQERVFELSADAIGAEDGPFEVAAQPSSAESRFDEHLQQTYVAYAGNEIPSEEHVDEHQFDSSDSLEQPLPPISMYVSFSTFLARC
jgi:hypothetical protein